MAGTTNRVPLEDAADLLESGRAALAVVVDGAPLVVPAVVRHVDGRFLAGVDGGAIPVPPTALDEAVLVIDDGVYFFDLRAIHVRGTPGPVAAPSAEATTWIEIVPTKVTCWDYGRLRVDDAAH